MQTSTCCALHGEATPATWSSEARRKRVSANKVEKRQRVNAVIDLTEPDAAPTIDLTETVDTQPIDLTEPDLVRRPSKHPRFHALALRRAGQRWSALVTAPTSRIARMMRPVLGDALWAAFVVHANARYKPAFLAGFQAPVLRCVGKPGQECDFAVDLFAPDAAAKLGCLHVDHEQDVQVTCDMWKNALPPTPVSWDDGIDGTWQRRERERARGGTACSERVGQHAPRPRPSRRRCSTPSRQTLRGEHTFHVGEQPWVSLHCTADVACREQAGDRAAAHLLRRPPVSAQVGRAPRRTRCNPSTTRACSKPSSTPATGSASQARSLPVILQIRGVEVRNL